MEAVNVAEGKARFSELVTRAAAGETVEITRRGKPLCKLVPMDAPRQPFDWAALQAFTATLPLSTLTVEEMRKRDLL